MKLVSPCDRAKNVSQETFKSPMRLFTALFLQLVSCDFSLSANQILDYFSSMGENQLLYLASIWLQYSFTIYIQVYIIILASNAKDILINIITTSKYRS